MRDILPCGCDITNSRTSMPIVEHKNDGIKEIARYTCFTHKVYWEIPFRKIELTESQIKDFYL